MKKTIVLMLIGTLSSGCVSSRININTNVTEARITVDGQLLGQTPINSIKVKNQLGKSYRVTIEKEGYNTYQGNLQKELKPGAITAAVFGYLFCWLLLPAPLMIYTLYAEGPTQNHYFILESKEAEANAAQGNQERVRVEVKNQTAPEATSATDGAVDMDSETENNK